MHGSDKIWKMLMIGFDIAREDSQYISRDHDNVVRDVS